MTNVQNFCGEPAQKSTDTRMEMNKF